jgi:hypothetical protein
LNLNGLWDYAGLPGTATAVPSEVRYGERILVPYPPESALSGIQRHDDQMSIDGTSRCRKTGADSGCCCISARWTS